MFSFFVWLQQHHLIEEVKRHQEKVKQTQPKGRKYIFCQYRKKKLLKTGRIIPNH
jgi:hypothetical protein